MGNNLQKTEKTALEIFRILDVDNSNTLDVEELKHLVENCHIHYELEDLMKAAKSNPREINIAEWKSYFVEGVEKKEIDLKHLQSAVSQLKNHKQLMRSIAIHDRSGLLPFYGSSHSNITSPTTPTGGNFSFSDEDKSTYKYGKVLKESGGMHVGKAWQQRSLELQRDRLYYYKVEVVRPMGEIPLEYVAEIKQDKCIFSVVVGSREFQFKCATKEEAASWVSAIQLNLASVEKRLNHIPKGKFWKCETKAAIKIDTLPLIDYKEVLQTMTTGDIILFQTKGVGPAIVRSATKSSYDHVGLFIRRGGKLGILESLGEPGVLVSGFEAFYDQGWNAQYTGLVVRKLEPPLSRKALRELKKFVRGVEGKKYSLTPIKLMRRESTLSFDDNNRTYFCSELVAKAFKHLSILRLDCPSTEYTPGSFSEAEKLIMQNGFSLGRERRIRFPWKRNVSSRK